MAGRRRCEVIAHRGGAAEAPENTWAGVEHTVGLGLPWMETDLRRSADGVVVLSHDEDLARTAGRLEPVASLMWEELSGLDAGDGRPPVRLDDLLYAFPDLCLNVDLKEPGVVQDALQVVRMAGALERVRFASFSARRLAVLRRQEPRARTSLGTVDVAGLVLRAEAAVALPHSRWGWPNGRVDAVQVPTTFRGVNVVTPRFVAQAHSYGLEVHVWTVNEPAEMRRLAALNVDAIITDVPQRALEVLGG
ncbi:glycerophosphodiester phosphodiesterase [Actinomyces faecalis]|uniref:glycerophosphodiester phosphodiesterase n=1 Tax=Actinomyces faecalis TaxID=2722820 RepID=UPI001551FA08|nr:glycerophosphodiester phosphodiesterase [Actinomyces faecalis]